MAKILIIDDESNIRMMLRLALEHVGHGVGQASDGYEGLALFGDGSAWDLVLLDHRMPGMEGIDVLRELRRRSAQARVVMITAFGTVDLATQAICAGATDFLRKPFTLEVLREAVTAALSDLPHLPHIATAAPRPRLTFERLGINGYRLECLPGIEKGPEESLIKVFSVQSSDGVGHACRVCLTSALVTQVKQHTADIPALAQSEKFWETLCGEALANYLWQNITLPRGPLLVEELTAGLKRWIDAVAQNQQEAA